MTFQPRDHMFTGKTLTHLSARHSVTHEMQYMCLEYTYFTVLPRVRGCSEMSGSFCVFLCYKLPPAGGAAVLRSLVIVVIVLNEDIQRLGSRIMRPRWHYLSSIFTGGLFFLSSNWAVFDSITLIIIIIHRQCRQEFIRHHHSKQPHHKSMSVQPKRTHILACN